MLNTSMNIHGVTRIEVAPRDPLPSGTDTRKITIHTPNGTIEIIAFGDWDSPEALRLPTDSIDTQ